MVDKIDQNTADSAGHQVCEQIIRLLIVDDQPLIRRGLAMMLGAEPDIEVVATAKDGEQAIEFSLDHSPDVIVMDLQMPGTSGVVATREITARQPETRVVVLTTFDHDDLVFDAIRAGAQAYLLKDATENEVLETVRAVHRGESSLSPSIARKVMSQFRMLSNSSDALSPLAATDAIDVNAHSTQGSTLQSSETTLSAVTEEPLTAKEEAVLGLLAQGKTNRQIATEVNLAEGTVKNYVSRIMDKLHAQSRTELAVRAVKRRQT